MSGLASGGKDAFRRRLAGVRRESARELRPESEGTEEPTPGLPVWFRRRRRPFVDVPAEPVGAAGKTAGEPERLEDFENDRGRYRARIERFAVDGRHGRFALEWTRTLEHELEHLGRDPALLGLDLGRAVYLDIETTGLSGGAGTIPFMVALGTFQDGEFELWQGFLDGPEDEPALLGEVARRVCAADSVVSFFGKSFDRHRLEDKMRVHGVEPPFTRPHLDLFHPLKRLYQGAYPDLRLATLERELCGVEREDDLPGSHAPAAWYDYLAGRAHRLEAVFAHNRDDVLSLVTLAAHLGCSLAEHTPDGTPLAGHAGQRARGLARLFGAAGQLERALRWTERAKERARTELHELHELEADLLRRSGRAVEAVAAYEKLRERCDEATSVRALFEIAKLCEHKLRDRKRAEEATLLAKGLAESHLVGAAREKVLEECGKRLARLGKRRRSASGEGDDGAGSRRVGE